MILLLAMFCASVDQSSRAQDSRKVILFEQAGFPAISSEPIAHPALLSALAGMKVEVADLPRLEAAATLDDASLLVLPYGSAVPADAWTTILAYLGKGGNLLVLGGQPLRVPVRLEAGIFHAGRPQDSYAARLGFEHTYEVPVPKGATFAWKEGYSETTPLKLQAKHFYAVEGSLDGLGYMVGADGELVAAPVIFANGTIRRRFSGRVVALDFDPAPGFWSTPDGMALIRRGAEYARAGVSTFSVETLFATLRPGEIPVISVHLRRTTPAAENEEEIKVELRHEGKLVETTALPLHASDAEALAVAVRTPLAAGMYQISATWRQRGRVREFSENGFWVSPETALRTGARLGVAADVLTKDGEPFLPVGTNYFTTENNGWSFSGPRNAAIWEHDFRAMQAHGVSFVRTGVWLPHQRVIEGDLGAVNERFLRNLEAFLLSAQRHSIMVNFTFFAFSPSFNDEPEMNGSATKPNPYLDAEMLERERRYIQSVVTRFRDVPSLSWDLINEPSVSNPKEIFKGNYPNGDRAERTAWHQWLSRHYSSPAVLADAWSVTPEELGEFDTIPLPSIEDLTYKRYGNPRQVRALDYNLFAQELFRDWVHDMLGAIRKTGSTQLVDVGQDEGGVTNRVLNQFYADRGLSFTTNHTYWEDDSLLWDSVAAKTPGRPNITGETGYQPAWAPDGGWRYDELTGLGLTERKWALGFAAGSTGALQWDWAREADFGMLRSDGSNKVWVDMMRDLGLFAKAAEVHAHGLILPEIALVLPQSLQLSVLNGYGLRAQQAAVRALYYEAHGAAYAVGEYQIDQLGSPKLILLPSPMGLSEPAWQAIESKVRAGATLLVTGPFDADEHLHPTARQDHAGLPYVSMPMTLREARVHWPGGDDLFTFGDQSLTVLSRAQLGGNEQWKEVVLGQGRILFAPLPLELGKNPQALARIYRYAMQTAHVASAFETTSVADGILICPTQYADSTLYVLTSETGDQRVTFRDRRSNRSFTTTLAAGRAAIVHIGLDGRILASYHFQP